MSARVCVCRVDTQNAFNLLSIDHLRVCISNIRHVHAYRSKLATKWSAKWTEGTLEPANHHHNLPVMATLMLHTAVDKHALIVNSVYTTILSVTWASRPCPSPLPFHSSFIWHQHHHLTTTITPPTVAPTPGRWLPLTPRALSTAPSPATWATSTSTRRTSHSKASGKFLAQHEYSKHHAHEHHLVSVVEPLRDCHDPNTIPRPQGWSFTRAKTTHPGVDRVSRSWARVMHPVIPLRWRGHLKCVIPSATKAFGWGTMVRLH